MHDVRQVALLRNSAAAEATLKVASVAYASKSITQPIKQAMPVDSKIKTAQLHMDAWEHYQKAANDEVTTFKQICLERKQQRDERTIHDLSEATRLAEAAALAAQAYSKTHLFSPALGSNLERGASECAQFKLNLALLEECPAGVQILTMFLWDLNRVPATLLRAQEIKIKLAPQLQLVKRF